MYKHIGIVLFFISSIHAIGDGPSEIVATEEQYVVFMSESITQIETDLNNSNSIHKEKAMLLQILSDTLTQIKERKKRGELSVLSTENLVRHYMQIITVVEKSIDLSTSSS